MMSADECSEAVYRKCPKCPLTKVYLAHSSQYAGVYKYGLMKVCLLWKKKNEQLLEKKKKILLSLTLFSSFAVGNFPFVFLITLTLQV